MAKPVKPSTVPEGGYTITHLAEEVGRDQRAIRTTLRNLEIEKEGGRYNWSTQKEFDAVVKQVSEASPEAREPAPAKKAAAPAKKAAAPAKKPAPAKKKAA